MSDERTGAKVERKRTGVHPPALAPTILYATGQSLQSSSWPSHPVSPRLGQYLKKPSPDFLPSLPSPTSFSRIPTSSTALTSISPVSTLLSRHPRAIAESVSSPTNCDSRAQVSALATRSDQYPATRRGRQAYVGQLEWPCERDTIVWSAWEGLEMMKGVCLPIGSPAPSFMAVSISLAEASPRSTIRTASSRYGTSKRLTINLP